MSTWDLEEFKFDPVNYLEESLKDVKALTPSLCAEINYELGEYRFSNEQFIEASKLFSLAKKYLSQCNSEKFTWLVLCLI